MVAIGGTSLLSVVFGRTLFAGFAGFADFAGFAAAQVEVLVRARPRAGVKTSITGLRKLQLDADRDAILRVPPDVSKPLPLLVALHGAGQSAEWMMGVLGGFASAGGVAILAVNSRDVSWDAIRGGFGPDVSFIDRALAKTYELVAVDPARVALGGFSDGATYALSLGLINGNAFPRIVAFSPGFVVEGTAAGKPEFFISHGTADRILPIDRCSRRIVPELRKRGYTVDFREFDGGHMVPDAMARAAMQFIAAPPRG
jgi:predicted esterase